MSIRVPIRLATDCPINKIEQPGRRRRQRGLAMTSAIPEDIGRRTPPGRPNLRQSRLFGRMLRAVGIVVGITGALMMLLVIPLGGENAEAYVEKLPQFLQDLFATVPEGT